MYQHPPVTHKTLDALKAEVVDCFGEDDRVVVEDALHAFIQRLRYEMDESFTVFYQP